MQCTGYLRSPAGVGSGVCLAYRRDQHGGHASCARMEAVHGHFCYGAADGTAAARRRGVTASGQVVARAERRTWTSHATQRQFTACATRPSTFARCKARRLGSRFASLSVRLSLRLAASSFEQAHEVASAINTLSIHAKLRLEGIADPAHPADIEQARRRLLGFLARLRTVVREGEVDGGVVGADPQLGYGWLKIPAEPCGSSGSQLDGVRASAGTYVVRACIPTRVAVPVLASSLAWTLYVPGFWTATYTR